MVAFSADFVMATAPKFKAASKAKYPNLETLANATTAKVSAPPKAAVGGRAVGKAKAKALSVGADGSLRVKGRELTAASISPFPLPLAPLSNSAWTPCAGIGVNDGTAAVAGSALTTLRNLGEAERNPNLGVIIGVVGAYALDNAPLGPWPLAITSVLANCGVIPPRYIQALDDADYSIVSDYDFTSGCDLLGLDTSSTETEALDAFALRLGAMFTSLLLSVGQASFTSYTALFNRILENARVPELTPALVSHLDKIHKVCDHRLLVIHGLVAYFPDATHIRNWELPDVVISRAAPQVIPFLVFATADLVLQNRLDDAIHNPGCTNLRTLLAVAPAIKEAFASSIHAGKPDSILRLKAVTWTLINEPESVVHRRGLAQVPPPTVAVHALGFPPEVESYVWGPGRDISLTAQMLRADILSIAQIIPTLALNPHFTASRALANKEGVNSGHKHALLEGIAPDRELLDQMEIGVKLTDSLLATAIETELNASGVTGGAIRTPVPIAASAVTASNILKQARTAATAAAKADPSGKTTYPRAGQLG